MDELKRAVLTALGPNPTPKQREHVADELIALATDQRKVAKAQRSLPRKSQGLRGRKPEHIVRIHRTQEQFRERITIYLGRGFYYDLNFPRWLAVSRRGDQVYLEVVEDPDDGYTLTVKKYAIPHFTADGARDVLGSLEDGRYSGKVVGGKLLEIGEALPSRKAD